MMKKICVNCRYSERIRSYIFECRKYAPTLLQNYNAYKGEQEIQLFPVVFDDSWCGEFEPKESEE
jgi:hypothetical protein